MTLSQVNEILSLGKRSDAVKRSEPAGFDKRGAGTTRNVDRVFVSGARVVARMPLFDDASEILLFVVEAEDSNKRIPRRLAGQFVRDEVKLVFSDGLDLHCLSFSIILPSELAGFLTRITRAKGEGKGNMFADTEQSIQEEV
ncbi:hypothetical protein [Noviherbaspirillum sp. ST9]|uniref:hypothetical protein n=1 Tax=Noviherbaspirillum sp. ST9 TaxID=3401606 RepID=UPI003B587399